MKMWMEWKLITQLKTRSANGAGTRQVVRWAGSGMAGLQASLLAIVFLLVGSASAQQTTGIIIGTVKDPTGALINSATVKATNLDTGFSRSAQTNSFGEYRIDYLPVGKYKVEGTATGFKHFVQENLTLDVDQTLTLEFALSVGAATETVTVETAPPAITRDLPITFRTNSRLTVSPRSGSSVHFASNSSSRPPASTTKSTSRVGPLLPDALKPR